MTQEEKEIVLGLGLTTIGVAVFLTAIVKAPQVGLVIAFGCTGWCIGKIAENTSRMILTKS